MAMVRQEQSQPQIPLWARAGLDGRAFSPVFLVGQFRDLWWFTEVLEGLAEDLDVGDSHAVEMSRLTTVMEPIQPSVMLAPKQLHL